MSRLKDIIIYKFLYMSIFLNDTDRIRSVNYLYISLPNSCWHRLETPKWMIWEYYWVSFKVIKKDKLIIFSFNWETLPHHEFEKFQNHEFEKF